MTHEPTLRIINVYLFFSSSSFSLFVRYIFECGSHSLFNSVFHARTCNGQVAGAFMFHRQYVEKIQLVSI